MTTMVLLFIYEECRELRQTKITVEFEALFWILCNRILTTNIFHRLKQAHPLIHFWLYIRKKERHVTSESNGENLTEIFQILTTSLVLVKNLKKMF